mgnify:CR=1 FL=1
MNVENVDMLMNVFGERLIPMLQSEETTDYVGIVLESESFIFNVVKKE